MNIPDDVVLDSFGCIVLICSVANAKGGATAYITFPPLLYEKIDREQALKIVERDLRGALREPSLELLDFSPLCSLSKKEGYQ